jgi:hypothetical protein
LFGEGAGRENEPPLFPPPVLAAGRGALLLPLLVLLLVLPPLVVLGRWALAGIAKNTHKSALKAAKNKFLYVVLMI